MLIVLLLVLLFTIPAMATSGNVAGAVQQTWKDAASPVPCLPSSQYRTVELGQHPIWLVQPSRMENGRLLQQCHVFQDNSG